MGRSGSDRVSRDLARGNPSGLYVRAEGNQRLALRPQRQPGVAPACEDDLIGNNGVRRLAPITLPRVKFLEKKL